jgi:hypothetical protein
VITYKVSSLPEAVDDSAMLVNPENVFDIARGFREALLDADAHRRASFAKAKKRRPGLTGRKPRGKY